MLFRSRTRHVAFADIPTFAESGLVEFEPYAWSGFFAPTGTPQPILDRLGDAFAKVIRSPELIEQYRRSGTDAVGNSPAEFAAFVKAEQSKWSRVIRATGVKLEQ